MFIPEKINLLFIEDDKSNAQATMKLLEISNHIKFNVIHRSTLKSGLEFLANECSIDSEVPGIDVILLDLMLPNSQGVDTYIRIRDACDFVPVVIMSCYEDIACECVKEGAQDFLIKPVNKGLLTRSLKYAIERKKIEDEKLMIENQFKRVIESTPLGVHTYEIIGNRLIFTGHNPASNKILNVDNSQFIGKSIKEAFPTLDPIIEEEYRQVIKTGEAWNTDFVEYKHGSDFGGSYRVHAFKIGPNCMATSFEDVTVKVKMEEKLKESEQHYRTLVEATNASIYEIDFINNKFVYVNDVMCEKTGYAREELMNMSPTDMLTDESIQKWADRWEALNRGEYIERTFEYEATVKDGSKKWTLITAEYKEDINDNIIGARVVAIDITEAKTAKEEVRKKEKLVFDELENKIQQWRVEITEGNLLQKNKIQAVSMNIGSLTNSVEVS